MSEIKEIVVDPQEEPKVDPIQPSDLDSLDVKELVRIIKETRGDAASNRIAAKDLQTKLDKIAAGEKKEKEDDLKKKGEFELLLVEKEKLIAELSPLASAYTEMETTERELIKTALGEDYDESFDVLKLPALKKLSNKLLKTVANIGVDNPNKGAKEYAKVELTEQEKHTAIMQFPGHDTEKAYEAFKDLKIKRIDLENKHKKET